AHPRGALVVSISAFLALSLSLVPPIPPLFPYTTLFRSLDSSSGWACTARRRSLSGCSRWVVDPAAGSATGPPGCVVRLLARPRTSWVHDERRGSAKMGRGHDPPPRPHLTNRRSPPARRRASDRARRHRPRDPQP